MMIISGEVVKVKRHVDFVNSETADCVSEFTRYLVRRFIDLVP